MSIVSSFFNMLKRIFKKIVSFVAKVVKKLWPLLLIVAVVYFAPAITTWLTNIGAPSWLTTAFTSISGVTPYVTTAVDWVVSGAVSLAGSAWNAYSSLGAGTKLAIAAGVAAAMAPEEFTDFVTDTAAVAGDVLSTVAGAAAGALASSPVGVIAIGAGLIWLVSRSRDRRDLA